MFGLYLINACVVLTNLCVAKVLMRNDHWLAHPFEMLFDALNPPTDIHHHDQSRLLGHDP